MDTKQVIARFEAERQALAMMDHPNIAKVLDAGATESGRPYFVMELVRGIPITDYCDREQLSIPERLELFVLVCRAVQHAHQKGIIHRDLKPSNILVTVIDGAAVPKVIDFGVAKATGAAAHRADDLHRLPPVHRHAAVHEPRAGRPRGRGRRHPQRHLQPGRAALRAADRHDAVRPGDVPPGRLRRDAPDHPRGGAAEAEHAAELARRDADDRLGQSQGRRPPPGPDRPRRAGLDRDEGAGEGPARRYETANDFAADVMRYLTDQPVEACPPSAVYRLRKFIRRNRRGLATVGIVAVALVAATAVSTWQAVRARDAQHQAEADRDRAKNAEIQAKHDQDRAQAAERAATEAAIARAVNDFLQADVLGQVACRAGTQLGSSRSTHTSRCERRSTGLRSALVNGFKISLW